MDKELARGEDPGILPSPGEGQGNQKPSEQLGQQPLSAAPEGYVVFPGELASPRSPPREFVLFLGEAPIEKRATPSRKPESIPRSKKARIAELVSLYHQEIHLPSVTKDLTPEEEKELQVWVNFLTYNELRYEIRKCREKLKKDMENQRPIPGLARA